MQDLEVSNSTASCLKWSRLRFLHLKHEHTEHFNRYYLSYFMRSDHSIGSLGNIERRKKKERTKTVFKTKCTPRLLRILASVTLGWEIHALNCVTVLWTKQ